jgi:glutaredoxin-like YruB-family protein
MTQIRIYSTPWCAYCRAEKQFLDDKGVKYENVDVEADPAAAREMVKLSGQMGVPVTIVTHDDKTQELLVGFDPDWLTQRLNLA